MLEIPETFHNSGSVPSLFISHGAPTLAIKPGPSGLAMESLGNCLRKRFPELQGVIVMSPHWMAKELSVQSYRSAPILHDFGGFPESLYALDYPAPGSPEAAVRMVDCLWKAGFDPILETKRGLDHGVWVPLRYLYPDAILPVIQVSMPYPADPELHFRIGEALRPLSAEGYLILGSGGLTHNLSHFMGQSDDAEPLDYIEPFAEWFYERLRTSDLLSLFQYRRLAPAALLAHPFDDHLMPLFFALGAGPSLRASRLHRGVSHSLLAMDIYAFGDPLGLDLNHDG